MFILLESRARREKKAKQPGLAVRLCKGGLNGGVLLANSAKILLHKRPQENDETSQPHQELHLPASVFLHDSVPTPVSVPGPANVPLPVNLSLPIISWEKHQKVFTERQIRFLGKASQATDIDRISQEASEALDHIEFPSVEHIEDPHPETPVVSEDQLAGEGVEPRPENVVSGDAQREFTNLSAGDTGAPETSQLRRVSRESERTLVNSSAEESRSQSVEKEESLSLPHTLQLTIDKVVTGPSGMNAKTTNHRGSSRAVALLEQARCGCQNLQDENDRLKAEIEALRARNELLESQKEVSEAVIDAYEVQLAEETKSKAELETKFMKEEKGTSELEQQLEEERKENFELLQKNCQQAKKASRNEARLKAFGRQAFERMILLCQMLTHFGVNTRNDDHEVIGHQALDLVGAVEKKFVEGYAKQARKACGQDETPEAMELREQQAIEQMEDRMADENLGSCWHDFNETWVNRRTGDEIKKEEKTNEKKKKKEEKKVDSVAEKVQDPRWMPAMEDNHRFWRELRTPSPSKEELDDVYREED